MAVKAVAQWVAMQWELESGDVSDRSFNQCQNITDMLNIKEISCCPKGTSLILGLCRSFCILAKFLYFSNSVEMFRLSMKYGNWVQVLRRGRGSLLEDMLYMHMVVTGSILDFSN